MEEIGTNNQVVTVFLLFRSMEGVERALYAFKSYKITRMWLSIFTCCMSKRQKSKLFKGKWLKVQPAVEPELLLWENFGVSRWGRFLRVLLYVVFVLVMLIVCFYIISYLEGEQNHYENELSGSQCGTSVDASAANLDFLAVNNARTGDFHCFCKIMLDT